MPHQVGKKSGSQGEQTIPEHLPNTDSQINIRVPGRDVKSQFKDYTKLVCCVPY